ncbi:MAG: tRNA (adenosine(37)-N6)-threonylcarbamoyltransferase complex dimerization subunit type 1 TsaB [Candidatus Omnitrophica bacterium]|jgi:tRNA threonylcarbamoyladenosine biosynthesis protein TsaB|nr:tRNA (adenosine(37)-N6)-threonylcarbamoyltransferase complex dimerization subunit type 1 TsaB [Candidatus Omnitrophota bacterium]
MKILAIDTSTNFFSVGILDGEKIYEYRLYTGVKLSENITHILSQILTSLNWEWEDLDYLAANLGPGSFTGIRIGLSFIKGIAFSLDKPVIGLCGLDVLAKAAADKERNIQIVPVMDARRGMVYAAIYQNHKVFKRSSNYMLVTPEELCLKIKGPSLFVGDGLSLYQKQFQASVHKSFFLDKDWWGIKPRYLVQVAQEKLQCKQFTDSFGIKPIYLYPKECQIRKPSAVSYQPSAKN